MPEQPSRDPTTGQLRPGGASLNPAGRPPRRTEAVLLRAFRAAVTDEDITALVKSLLAQAQAGDVQAATLVLRYLLGQPPAAPAPEPEDESEPVNKPRSAQEQAADLTRRFDAHEARGIPINPLAREAVQMIFNGPRLGDRPVPASSEDAPEDAA